MAFTITPRGRSRQRRRPGLRRSVWLSCAVWMDPRRLSHGPKELTGTGRANRCFFAAGPGLGPRQWGNINDNNSEGTASGSCPGADRALRRAGAGALLRRVRLRLSGILQAVPGVLPALSAAAAGLH